MLFDGSLELLATTPIEGYENVAIVAAAHLATV